MSATEIAGLALGLGAAVLGSAGLWRMLDRGGRRAERGLARAQASESLAGASGSLAEHYRAELARIVTERDDCWERERRARSLGA